MTDPLLGWTFWMQYGVINMRCKQTIPNLVNQNSVASEGAPHAPGTVPGTRYQVLLGLCFPYWFCAVARFTVGVSLELLQGGVARKSKTALHVVCSHTA